MYCVVRGAEIKRGAQGGAVTLASGFKVRVFILNAHQSTNYLSVTRENVREKDGWRGGGGWVQVCVIVVAASAICPFAE